jgi:hypothetical protein
MIENQQWHFLLKLASCNIKWDDVRRFSRGPSSRQRSEINVQVYKPDNTHSHLKKIMKDGLRLYLKLNFMLIALLGEVISRADDASISPS